MRISFSAENKNSEFSFSLRAFVEDDIRIGSDIINTPDLRERYPQLAPTKQMQHKYEVVEIIIGQDF